MRLMKSARAGDGDAQLALGRLYLAGAPDLAANPAAAFNWLSRAWAGGRGEAALAIAEHLPPPLVKQYGSVADYVRACRWAAAQGSVVAAYHLGELLLAGHEGAPDREGAMAAFSFAAEAGHAAAARRVGEMMAESASASTDPICVRRWLEQAAQSGDEAAGRRLADLLWVARDPEAIRWLTPLAEANDAEAMCRLGELQLAAGKTADATRWLKRAAQQDHARALWLFGRAHARKLLAAEVPLAEAPNSPLTAARLLERAAEQDWAPAYWDLARIFEHTGFSRRDLRVAREYLERAARAGVADAQSALGERLAARAGDLQAWLAAGRWLELALESGQTGAEATLATIADRAPQWPEETRATQQRMLPALAAERPRLAARLGLAAAFGLTTRETVFIDPVGAEQGWCLLVDLSGHFRYKPWRLVRIKNETQREAIAIARQAFLRTDAAADLSGNDTRRRARQLDAAARALQIDPALFVADWHAPS
jgi:TPR repeat protein